jgi:transposase-like protein
MGYPSELKQQVLARMMPPANESIGELARNFNVTESTLYAWRSAALKSGVVVPGNGRSADKWSSAAEFAVVLETAGLAEAELGEYCRARGLFVDQVDAWRAAFQTALDQTKVNRKPDESKVDKKRIRQLEREISRKDRALAEAAALLILRKKVVAIWGEEEE